MSLRDRHRQLINQSNLDNEMFENQNTEMDLKPTSLNIPNEQNKSDETTAPAPSPIQSAGLSRPKNSHVIPITEADLKRKAYLAAAKERNDKTKHEFEDRVKGYFERGLAIEQQKMISGSNVKKTNKEKNAEAVESGLFLQQLKQIGIDVGKMSKSSQAMKPVDDERKRPSTVSTNRPNVMEGNATPASHSSHSVSSLTSTGLEARIANIERVVTSIHHSVSEHERKLDNSIQLQQQILTLLQAQQSGSVSDGSGGGMTYHTGASVEEASSPIRRGRNRRY